MIGIRRHLHEFTKGPYGTLTMAAGLIAAVAVTLVAAAPFVPVMWPAVPAIALASILIINVLLIAIVSRVTGRLVDLSSSVSLRGTLAALKWQPRSFFTDGAAATPTLQLLLIKCLQYCEPRRILELGSGQTSKLLAFYARDSGAYVTSLEEDGAFSSLMSTALGDDNPNYHYLWRPLHPVRFTAAGIEVSTQWYAQDTASLHGPYNLVLVDGPAEVDATFARSGVLTCIPSHLAESFVVIFDDVDRHGVSTTVQLFKSVLDAATCSYCYFEVHGSKTHAVFCSNDFRFLRST